MSLGRPDDAREPGGLTMAMRLSASVARLCFEHEAVVLDVLGARWENVLMCVCVCGVLRHLENNRLTALPADFCSGCSSLASL